MSQVTYYNSNYYISDYSKNYKTKLCWYFKNNLPCIHIKCAFAHGEHELKINNIKQYKKNAKENKKSLTNDYYKLTSKDTGDNWYFYPPPGLTPPDNLEEIISEEYIIKKKLQF